MLWSKIEIDMFDLYLVFEIKFENKIYKMNKINFWWYYLKKNRVVYVYVKEMWVNFK